jgi:hypothetical protein
LVRHQQTTAKKPHPWGLWSSLNLVLEKGQIMD